VQVLVDDQGIGATLIVFELADQQRGLARESRHVSAGVQLAASRRAIRMMEDEAAAGQVPTQGDRLFHTRIAEACENSVLLRLVCELFDERRNPLFEQLGNHFESASSWASAIAEHRNVLEAIASKSPQAARDAMAQHLSRSHDRFTANFATGAGTDKPARGSKATARRAAAGTPAS